MKFLDFLIGLLIFWGAYNGYQKGIVKQLASLLGIIAGIFLAKNFYPNLDLKLQKTFESEAGFISIISLYKCNHNLNSSAHCVFSNV